jgi:hypothetical protein
MFKKNLDFNFTKILQGAILYLHFMFACFYRFFIEMVKKLYTKCWYICLQNLNLGFTKKSSFKLQTPFSQITSKLFLKRKS